ncbi:MAG: hypothetical protein QGF53_12345, partial [Alphaproteobacteria bacterium]|nr:hypothetical protein [Alphaproteobacteria bacterium]
MLSGCGESDEERALAAYRDARYDEAHTLALALVEAGQARGHELLALMAAQGLGRDTDFAAAHSHAEAAAQLDQSYAGLPQEVEAGIESRFAAAERTFANGDYERARALAAPLAEHGHAGGDSLYRRLYAGNYLVLDGSAMSWRSFRDRCSGMARSEGGDDDDAFAAHCAGKDVIWQGEVTAVRRDSISLKMTPGRSRVRYDVILEMAEPVSLELARRRARMRFAGTIAARGDASRPDRLSDGRLLGPGVLTAEEIAETRSADEARQRGAAMEACRRIARERMAREHPPPWIAELMASLSDVERRAARIYYFFGIHTGIDAMRRSEDGGWEVRIEGYARAASPNHQISSITDFVADCHVKPDHAAALDDA